MGRSSEAKNLKNAEKVKCDGRTDGPTDQRTDKAGCRVAKHGTKKEKKTFMYVEYVKCNEIISKPA